MVPIYGRINVKRKKKKIAYNFTGYYYNGQSVERPLQATYRRIDTLLHIK